MVSNRLSITELISQTANSITKKRPSLLFVKAVNFEITYQCNMSCPHCIQHGLRQQGNVAWIDTEKAIQALQDSKSLGFTSSGVNFTGGEPFLPDSNLFELVTAARSLDLSVRVNTNGWWGGKQNIRVGSLEFASYLHVVGWLKNMDISALALSLDRRYDENPALWDSVISVIRECECQGLQYQIIFTGSTPEDRYYAWDRLTREKTIQLDHMIPATMEMVDLGAASTVQDICINSEYFCGGKGFYRPQFLHISPTGGVRTCLYAPGSQWLGNIHEQTLCEIADAFAGNPVVHLFCDDRRMLESVAELLYSVEGYQLPRHPCGLSMIVARTVDERFQLEKRLGRIPSEKEFSQVFAHIAKDYQLKKKNET